MVSTPCSFILPIRFPTSNYHHRRSVSSSTRMSLQHTRLRLQNPQNETLVALLTTKVPPPQPLNLDVIVLCHGFQDSKNGRLMTSLSENLPFATVRLDFSGNGESEGEFQYANYRKEVSDLRALIVHLRGIGGKVTTIVGHSKGAGVVLLYAAEYGDVANVVNLAARFDMRRGVRERFGEEKFSLLQQGTAVMMSGNRNGEEFLYQVTKEDIEERFRIDMGKTVEGISSDVRVLTVHGKDDEIIKIEDGHEIDGRVKNGRLVVLEQSGHSFQGFEDRVANAITDFVSVSAQES